MAARTIGKYVQRKIIPLHDNKIDPVEADECLREHLAEPLGSGNHEFNTGKANPETPSLRDDSSYTEARTREKNIKNEILELTLQLKKVKWF